MRRWRQAGLEVLAAGAGAGAASLAALLATGRRDAGSAVAPLNAVSHIVWGDIALRKNRPSLRYTATGLGLHLASAVFWAGVQRLVLGRRRRTADVAASALATAAAAAVVDLALVPPRIAPGFERRLSPESVALVFGAVALGLALGGARRRPVRRGPDGLR